MILNDYLCMYVWMIVLFRNALLVQLYLRIDRLDLAQKQVKQMKTTDEDSVLSMLANAWTNLATVSSESLRALLSLIKALMD
jgi:hypothetical protein